MNFIALAFSTNGDSPAKGHHMTALLALRISETGAEGERLALELGDGTPAAGVPTLSASFAVWNGFIDDSIVVIHDGYTWKRFLRHAFMGSPQFSRVKQIMAQSVDVSDWSQKTYPKQRKDLASILKRLGVPFDSKATGLEREIQALAKVAPAVLRQSARQTTSEGEAKPAKVEAAQAELPAVSAAVEAPAQPLSLGRRVQLAWRVLLDGHA